MAASAFRPRLRPVAALLAVLLLVGCDPDGKKKCAWVLEPEPRNEANSDPGMISVCARNRETMKEDCRLQTTMEYAKKALGRTFRYVDLTIESPGLPRTVKSITFCEK
jgi:hypothetical protein